MNLELRHRIAAELLGRAPTSEGYAPCPGRDKHSQQSGERDFRVVLDGAPTGFCFHSSCADAVERFNYDLRRRIAQAEREGDAPREPSPAGRVAPLPVPERKPKRPPFDAAMLEGFARRAGRGVSLEWLASRSPVPLPPPEVQTVQTVSGLFLDALFTPGEKVLVFTRATSQGDYQWSPGEGGHRLARERGVVPVPSPLPAGGGEGVWFLAAPVDGEWHVNAAPVRAGESPRWGRRHGDCVTAWRYLVIESDLAEPGLWLRALVQLPLRIVAIYTSGGRSIHALARLDVASKPEWDAVRDTLLPVLCPLGADPAAMTAVRLSRLPGCLRHGCRDTSGNYVRYESPRLQRLAWLNPDAPLQPLIDYVK